MATRAWFAHTGAFLTAIAVAAALTACGSPSAPDPSGSPTASVPASFASLPASALPTVTGVTYVESEASRAALARTHVGTTLSAFDGGLAREIQVGGTSVAVVQAYRFAGDIGATDRDRFLPMLVYVDSGVQPTQQALGGKKVQVVASVPGQDRAIVAWAMGDKVVLLSAADLATAQEYAGRLILASF